MKKRDISISLAVIVVSVLLLYSYFQGKGAIEVRAGDADVVLSMSGGLFGTTTIRSSAVPAEVNWGAHKPKSLQISIQEGSNKWQLESNGPWGKMSTVRVKNGDTAVLELGPPFTIKPEVRNLGPEVSIDLKILGRAGERYYNVIMQNGKRIESPGLEIINEEGNVLTAGKFKYG